jgi:hypothetical protein
VNGSAAATANSPLATGAPSRPPETVVPACSRPFAMGRRSAGTSSGRIANDDASNSVPIVDRANAKATNTGTLACPVATTTANASTSRHRSPSVTAMVNRRSHRSARAPPISPNRTDGICPATTTSARASGSRVSPAANSAIAGPRTASPKRETTVAVHIRQNAAPRRDPTPGSDRFHHGLDRSHRL